MKLDLVRSLLFSFAIAGPAAVQADVYSIGTNPQGSLGYSVAAGVAKAVESHTDHRVRVVPNSGPVVNFPLVDTGELDFAIGISTVTAFALDGSMMFKGRANNNIEVASYLFPIHVGAYVRNDSNIHSLKDLAGHKVPTEFTSQRIMGLEVEAVLAIAGLTADDIGPVPVPDGIRQVDEFINGGSDLFVFTVEAGKTIEANASAEIRGLSIPRTEGSAQILRQYLPGTHIETIEPSQSRPGILEPTNVLALPFVLVVGKHVPESVVYDVAQSLARNPDILVSVHSVFEKFDPNKITYDLGLPYHAGAKKFAAEHGENH